MGIKQLGTNDILQAGKASKKLRFAMIGIASSFFMANAAVATPVIMTNAMKSGVKVKNCDTCHTSNAVFTLKPVLASLPQKTFRDAFKADPTAFVKLKNIVNGCTVAGQTLNPTNFLCQVQAPVSGTVGSAASGAAATDVYTVTCGTGTTNLYARVKDMPAVLAPFVSIQAKKGLVSSTLSTDSVDADGLYSPAVSVNGAAGVFTVNVNKSAATVKGAEVYAADFYCRSATGAKTATKAVLSQNR